jgi:hypothetical protein
LAALLGLRRREALEGGLQVAFGVERKLLLTTMLRRPQARQNLDVAVALRPSLTSRGAKRPRLVNMTT